MQVIHLGSCDLRIVRPTLRFSGGARRRPLQPVVELNPPPGKALGGIFARLS
jgi:hypothetical protein